MTVPIIFECFPEGMKPLRRQANIYAAEYEPGKLYTLVPVEDRSAKSHRHFFASIHDLWLTLPEDMGERFPNSESLRKFALIKSGFCDERSIICSSKAEALRFAAFIKPMDDYALVVVKGNVVVQYTAKSQSMKSMGKADFQKSKDEVFRIIAEMLGATAQQAEAA